MMGAWRGSAEPITAYGLHRLPAVRLKGADAYLVLVEGESDETELLWQGRTALHAPEIDGNVLINDFGPHETLVPGTFYRAEITESHDYDVVARIIE